MQADAVRAHGKQFRHFALGKPDHLIFGPKLDLAPAVFRGVEDEVAHGEGEVLVPDIEFIVFDAVFVEKVAVFGLKDPRAVMLLLGVDVGE